MKRKSAPALVAAALAVLAAAPLAARGQAPSTAQDEAAPAAPNEAGGKVTVAYFLEWPTPNLVAQERKAFAEALGVEVEWRAFGNGNEMSLAMASGDVDIAYSQGLVPWVVAVSNGLPLRLVGVAVTYGESDNCVVRDGAGITQANARELEGKRVATPIGNVTHYKLLRMLDHLDVDASRIDLVQMNSADGAVALARGDVTMACGFGGPVQRMLEHGAALMTAAEQEAIGIYVFDVVSVTERFAERSPDLVRKFMQVTAQANAAYAAAIGDERTELDRIMARASGMELEAAQEFLADSVFPTVQEQQSEAWMGGGLQTYVRDVAEFFVEQGQLERALDSYDFAIDPGFL